MSNTKQDWAKNILLCTVGTLIASIAINFFMVPSSVISGGVRGLAIVLMKVTGIPVYVTNLVINIILFVLGYRTLKKKTAYLTIYSMILMAIFLKFIPIKPFTDNQFLAGVFGGSISGVGLGLIFLTSATTGGTDLLGRIINAYFPNIKFQNAMYSIDGLVLILNGIANGSTEILLLSVMTIFIEFTFLNKILGAGGGYTKGLFIISEKPRELGDILLKELGRGLTSLKGEGLYSKKEKDVILCVVPRSQFIEVKEIIKETDPNAFIMVTDMAEIYGGSFTKLEEGGE
ncbi:MAG: YitT family protein [Tissierellia bacterium]|nr:YitT family protein [Tissierellia bacterium]